MSAPFIHLSHHPAGTQYRAVDANYRPTQLVAPPQYHALAGYRPTPNAAPPPDVTGRSKAGGRDLRIIELVNYDGVVVTQKGTPDYPLVEVVLSEGAVICSEPGRMIMLPEEVHFETIFGDGRIAGAMATLTSAASRMFSGENVYLNRYTNESDEQQTMHFGTVVPGGLLVLNMADWDHELVGMSGVYLLGTDQIKVEVCFRQRSIGAALFSGESIMLQRISGEGVVVLQAGGGVIRRDLTPQRPMIKVEVGCLVAFTKDLEYNIAMAGNLKSCFFGGAGFFVITLQLKPGHIKGTVWVETFPYRRFLNTIEKHYPH